jgi:IS5 family transposase
LVRTDHSLRKINNLVDFKHLANQFQELKKGKGRKGYGVEVGVKCLFLQFYYDLSDRQLEERMKDDLAFRWFCNLELSELTPDHSYFGRIRGDLGTSRIGKIFQTINKKACDKKIFRDVFTFVDASAIKVKEATWAERDKAFKVGEDKVNNDNIDKHSHDKDARFGCKGKDKFWYGYKKHVSVDMGSGLIEKVAVTPANKSDASGLKHVCPKDRMIFADKGYCTKEAQMTMQKRGCHSGAILKNNMKEKNKDRDKWISKVRSPFENIFSKHARRTRYCGLAKVQLQVFMEALVTNIKRLIVIEAPPLFN